MSANSCSLEVAFSFPLDDSSYPIDITRLRIPSISARSRGSASSGVLLFGRCRGDFTTPVLIACDGDNGCMISDMDSDGEGTDIEDGKDFRKCLMRRVSLWVAT